MFHKRYAKESALQPPRSFRPLRALWRAQNPAVLSLYLFLSPQRNDGAAAVAASGGSVPPQSGESFGVDPTQGATLVATVFFTCEGRRGPPAALSVPARPAFRQQGRRTLDPLERESVRPNTRPEREQHNEREMARQGWVGACVRAKQAGIPRWTAEAVDEGVAMAPFSERTTIFEFFFPRSMASCARDGSICFSQTSSRPAC